MGFGSVALSAMLDDDAWADRISQEVEAPRQGLHLEARAEHVIFCYMSGGVSQLDTLDPKPRLEREAGKPMPLRVERTQFNNNGNIQPSPWSFRRYGECGLPVSDLFPRVGACADDLAVVRSMTAKFSEHAQGNYFMHTGIPFLGFPSAGAWTTYGLGSQCKDIPGFVLLRSGDASVPHGGVGLFSNGFLPATHQASMIRADAGEPVQNIRPRRSALDQRRQLGFIAQSDRRFLQSVDNNEHIEAAIANYEMAYRMQSAVPELVDLGGETRATKAMYGLDAEDPLQAAYARQCLLARRLVERGVRFIELSCLSYNIGGGNGSNPWDQHSRLREGHEKMAHQVDQPIAALIKDLKARGLLKKTLIVWAGEFGRTPFSQGKDGRDHDPFGFSIWLAGGGVRGGVVYGATDEYGYHVAEDKCTVYDLWATVFHLLGVDHRRLTFRYGGRDIRMTDVYGNVIHQIVG